MKKNKVTVTILFAFFILIMITFLIVSKLNNPKEQTLVIGILSLPTDQFDNFKRIDFITASYVKFIESAGGRAIVIDWNQD